MPSSSTRWISLFLLSTALAAVALVAGALYYVLAMPSRSYRGALDFTPEERKLAERLRAHVAALATGERNRDLDRPARYIAGEFGQFREQPFESGGRTVRNIETGDGSVVVGAHYDTVPGSPGADDNASGVAVLIELARMRLPARFVAFANEEMPYFQGDEMGSHAYAARAYAATQSIDVTARRTLEVYARARAQ